MNRVIQPVFKGLWVAVFLSLIGTVSVAGEPGSPELIRLFPNKLGAFRQVDSIRSGGSICQPQTVHTQENSGLVCGESIYLSDSGEKLVVEILQLRHDADAYAALTQIAERIRQGDHEPGLIVQADVGTASVRAVGQIAFFKGLYFVKIAALEKPRNSTSLNSLARQFAEQFDKGEGDIPPLVKHLPGGDKTQSTARFYPGITFANFTNLNQPVLSALNGQQDADAVLASIDSSKVLIVEFNTPQLATENDHRIIAKIHELWNLGQPAPSAYRRVGNYSVFVFDAPDEHSAKLLIDEVKYEQVVQWLGDNPYLLQQAQKKYVDTTLGVFIAVIKASGAAFVGCFVAGGLLGALLFQRRRKQQRAVEAFSDAGGMLRLNLDELSAQSDTSRLLQE